MLRPRLLLVVSFEPTSHRRGKEHQELLAARTAARTDHPTFPPPDEATRHAAALDATMAAMEWPTEADEAEAGDESSRCSRGAELPITPSPGEGWRQFPPLQTPPRRA